MDSENQKVNYCADNKLFKVYCDVCDKLCIERYYKNHLESSTHTNNSYKRQIIHFPLK